MSVEDAFIRIVSDSAEEARSWLHYLREMAFPARLEDPVALPTKIVGSRDVILAVGTFMSGGRRALPPACHLNRNRSIVFLKDMRSDEFAGLERSGVRFIHSANSVTHENVIYLISQIDPDLVYAASKVRILRTEKSAVIERGALDFFGKLRKGEVVHGVDVARSARQEVQQLLSMSPMSVWLDLFQRYHDGTAQHCTLVSSVALVFAKSLGFGDRDIDRIYDAAFFHDVGKAMVPLKVLDKPGRLDEREWDLMKRHVIHGYDILTRDEATAGEIARVARDHHEYLDGTGYPNGIGAAEIDDPTRILTICDIFAALVEKRAYKPPRRPDEAFDILKSMAGTKLDPDLVKLFESVVDAYGLAQASWMQAVDDGASARCAKLKSTDMAALPSRS